MKTESDLIKIFRKFILKKYPNSDTYKNHGSGYSKSGQPDLQVLVPQKDVTPTLYIEFKWATSSEVALKKLSNVQKARIRELTLAGGLCFLVWNTGTALYSINVWLVESDKDYLFQGFETLALPEKEPKK